jgi:hypothetical protein
MAKKAPIGISKRSSVEISILSRDCGRWQVVTNGYKDWCGQWCMYLVSSTASATTPCQNFPSAALRATHWGIAQCLAGVRVKLEGQILTYHQEQQQQLQQVPTKVEVCAGADETF